MSTLTMTRPAITPEAPVSDRNQPVRSLAVVRISIGLTMLWSFIDKTFALGFATGRQDDGTINFFGDAAWLNGGSPTFGFLNFGARGPFADFFAGMAGAWWADWLFMLGLLGVGIAFTLGIAMRPAAAAGVLLMAMIWASALWPERNPLIDQHVIYSATMVALVATNAGARWGLGTAWARTSIVRSYPAMR